MRRLPETDEAGTNPGTMQDVPHSFVAEHPGMPPAPADRAQADDAWAEWRALAAGAEAALSQDMAAAESPPARRWLDALFGNSPYLTRLALREPRLVAEILARGPEGRLAELLDGLNREDPRQPRATLMKALRIAKRRAALVVGLADVAGVWTLDQVTRALSNLAAATLSAALRHLLVEAAGSGQIALAHPAEPERDCGIIILGMGKLGAFELNYSSDIDLIILFDAETLPYRGRDSAQGFMARLARDLVKLMEERTTDGYVFRTDLRLRPDPGSTPPAISVAAAESYYTSVGQNWERAALVKARPVAGDIAAGEAFLRDLTPFLWRKHLDFAAIQDILSIKRQIDARHGERTGDFGGYNVKLGHGGIREIEFFAQTQQLIWGGRIPALRGRRTIDTLHTLAATHRIDTALADELARAYGFLRQVEHRLQMVEDAQTHTLPSDPAAFARIAAFMGYESAAAFTAALAREVETVERHFRNLYPDAPPLSHEGNLVFTGNESDPDTLATLGRLGFTDPERVAEAIRGWHHGRIRATRSARARELLTELVPVFLAKLGRTAAPDLAFARFDEFLSRLAAGVQLFSLFQHRPELFDLVAEIMGEAPLLASHLARRPLLLDSVLTGDFFASLPEDEEEALAILAGELHTTLEAAANFEDRLDLARRWAGDRKFQIGVGLLQRRNDGERTGRDFTLVAEAVVAALLPAVEAEFARQHGTVADGTFAVLALGKLGSREMNALSDLDLVFIYEAPEGSEGSDGPRALGVSTYFARLAQRAINALSAPTAEGGLYEVDMRLRPSGNAGPIASSFAAFRRYYDEQAWTWERMALTRGRIIAGDPALAAKVTGAIAEILTTKRNPDQLLADVAHMRARIAAAHPKPKPWDCKHRRGAIVDLEFIAQYLELRHAAEEPDVVRWRTREAFEQLAASGHLSATDAAICLDALRFWHRAQQTLRVSLGKVEGEDVAPNLLGHALARATGIEDTASRQALFEAMATRVLGVYDRIVAQPASELIDITPEETRTP